MNYINIHTSDLTVNSINDRDDQSHNTPINIIHNIPKNIPEPQNVVGKNNTPHPTAEHIY